MSPHRQRCFVAIDLPEPLVATLVRLRPREAPGVRPIPHDAIHLTLCFLGDQDVDAIVDVLVEVQMPGFDLHGAGLGSFGDRVLWAGVEATPALKQAHDTVVEALAPVGFVPEPRPFRPHITLGRTRSRAAAREFLSQPLEPWSLAATSMTLYTSELSHEGAIHRLVRRFPLA